MAKSQCFAVGRCDDHRSALPRVMETVEKNLDLARWVVKKGLERKNASKEVPTHKRSVK